MKQATNQFTKGLITDYDPLNCPNDILTDNLNGTIITMNGSEMVLQNDMGNSKVYYGKDSNGNDIPVKLNKGFIPVGIKEYGGIIYIASYNPKTNESEIGSFPSPTYELESSGPFKINKFFDINSCFQEYRILLFNGNPVYPGDIFTLALDNGEDLSEYESQIIPIEGSKKPIYKKNTYSIRLAVQDSSNNLINLDWIGENNFIGEHIYQNKFSGKLYVMHVSNGKGVLNLS